MADKVMTMPAPAAEAASSTSGAGDHRDLQRKEGEEEQKEEKDHGQAQPMLMRQTEDELQRKEDGEEIQRSAQDISVQASGEDELQRAADEELQRKAEGEEEVQRKEDEHKEETTVQRKCDACEKESVQRKEDKEEVQAKLFDTGISVNRSSQNIQRKELYRSPVIHRSGKGLLYRAERGPPSNSQPSFESSLTATRGTGSPLPAETRTHMEDRFNADFSGVRIHTNETSVRMNNEISAQAFTYGNDIYFNSGKYSPSTSEGQRLIAHELTHTIQQGASSHRVAPSRQAVDRNGIARKIISPKLKIQRSASNMAAAVGIAKAEAGQVIANKEGPDGFRFGWMKLMDFFKTSLGADKIIPDGVAGDSTTVSEGFIKKKKEIDGMAVIMPNGKPGIGKRDAMPSWCGIFAFWALNKAGIPMKKWTLGKMTVPPEAVIPPGQAPPPGALAYRDLRSHYALVEKAEGTNVTTVNGNTAGTDNLGGEIQVQTHALSEWTAFFDPMKLSDGAVRDPQQGAAEKPKSLNDLRKELFNVQRKENTEQKEQAGQAENTVASKASEPAVNPSAHTDKKEELQRKEEHNKEEENKNVQAKQFEGKVAETEEEERVPAAVHRKSEPKVQRGVWGWVKGKVNDAAEWVGDKLEEGKKWLLKKVRNLLIDLPVYKAVRVALGEDPVTGERVERNGRNFIDAAADLMPGGQKIRQKLEELGILQKAEQFVDRIIGRLGQLISGIYNVFSNFWNSLSLSDLKDIPGVFGRLKDAFTSFFDQVADFAIGVAKDFLEFIKQALLIPLGNYIKTKTRFWDLLCLIMGKDPLTDEPRAVNGVNILNAFLNLSEWGVEQKKKMQETGTFNKVAAWIDKGIAIFSKSYDELKAAFLNLWTYVTIDSLMEPVETFKKIFDSFWRPVKRVGEYVIETGIMILKIVKEALYKWISEEAKKKKGYFLITVLISKDPFTDERVPRTTENLVKGFMLLSDNGEEQFNKMKESGAMDRATEKIDAAVKRLGFTWAYVKSLFINLWNSFTWKDLVVPVLAFAKIINTFAQPILRLINFIIEVVVALFEVILRMMGFPVDMVFKLIANIRKAWKMIKSNVTGFLKNILVAIKQGFSQFFDNFLKHLVNGLVDWLFDQLSKVGITKPEDFSFKSIIKLIMQVLGITMEKIWKKLSDRIGEEKVAKIKGAIDKAEGVLKFVKDIQEKGIGAIWEYIQEKLNNLWTMVLEAATNWIMEKIIGQVTAKLLSMLDPTGIMAVINSVIAIYKAIESFIEYFTRMLGIVNSFVEGIIEIAEGNTKKAADFLERSMASAVPIVIGFLANQVGLGKIGRKIVEVIEKVQAKVDEGLTWLVDKAVTAAESLYKKLKQGVEKVKDAIKGLFGKKKKFKSGKAEHSMYFVKSGNHAQLMVATTPKRFEDAVTDRRKEIDNDASLKGSEKGVLKGKLTRAEKNHGEMKKLENDLTIETDAAKKASLQRDIFELVDKIISVLAEVGVTDHDVAREVKAAPVVKGEFIKQGTKEYKVEETDDQKQFVKAVYLGEKKGTSQVRYSDYGITYHKIEAPSQIADPELQKLNQLTEWDSYPDANKVLNYRRSGFQLNSNKSFQWEHTVERTAGERLFGSRMVNNQTNLAWASAKLNHEVGTLYKTYDRSKLGFLPSNLMNKLQRVNSQGLVELISPREYLDNCTDFGEHKQFKQAYYRFKGVSIKVGKFNNQWAPSAAHTYQILD
jgi:hypothetical protein